MAASPSEDDVCLMGVCVKRVYRRLCDVRACQRVTNAAVSYHVWRCYDTLTTLSLKDAHTHRDRHTQECIWSILTSKHFRSAVSRVQQVVLSFLKRFSFFFSLVAVKWYLQSRLLVFKCEDFRGDSKKNPQRLIAWKKKILRTSNKQINVYLGRSCNNVVTVSYQLYVKAHHTTPAKCQVTVTVWLCVVVSPFLSSEQEMLGRSVINQLYLQTRTSAPEKARLSVFFFFSTKHIVLFFFLFQSKSCKTVPESQSMLAHLCSTANQWNSTNSIVICLFIGPILLLLLLILPCLLLTPPSPTPSSFTSSSFFLISVCSIFPLQVVDRIVSSVENSEEIIRKLCCISH